MKNHELKWWQVRWGLADRAIFRFAIVSGKIIGLLCLVAALGYSVLYLISPWLAAKRLGEADSRLSMVPSSLPNKVEVPLSGVSIDQYGFKFQLPNKEIVKAVGGRLTTVVLFRKGGFLMVHNTSREWGIPGFVNNDKQAQRLLGQDEIHSKLKLMRAVMSATPEQVKWWKFRSLENERFEYLLVMKFVSISRLTSLPSGCPIYTIASGEFRGFQIGNPDVAPYEAQVDLFDAADRYFALDVMGSEGHGQVLTQEEINAIVASIRRDSDH